MSLYQELDSYRLVLLESKNSQPIPSPDPSAQYINSIKVMKISIDTNNIIGILNR